MRIYLTLGLFICLSIVKGQTFESGLEFYEAKNFSVAAQTWKFLIEQGQISESVYYNLGNAYVQEKNYSEAIYYFNKALRINPQSADAHYNLGLANRLGGIEVVELPGWSIRSKLLLFAHLTSTLNFLFIYCILAVTALLFMKYVKNKRTAPTVKFLFVVSAIAILLGTIQEYYKYANKEAILMKESPVFLSPDEISQKKLELVPGEKLFIIDQIKEWSKIQTSNFETGWILTENYRRLEE